MPGNEHKGTEFPLSYHKKCNISSCQTAGFPHFEEPPTHMTDFPFCSP